MQATTAVTPAALVAALFEAFQKGDVATILAHVAPEATWIAPGTDIPSAGSYRGPQGAADFFAKLMESETFQGFEPRQYISNGEDVIALGSEACVSNKTGKAMSTEWSMHFKVVNGMVTHWRCYYDTEAYFKAHQR